MTVPLTDMRRWQDWASFALGLWLAVSPWIADYASHDAATANAAICGLALALAAHFCFACDHVGIEWLHLTLGLWLIASPFALSFAANHVAAVNAVAVGLFVTLLSAWALELDRDLGRLWNRLIVH
jgi:hypothetical protein